MQVGRKRISAALKIPPGKRTRIKCWPAEVVAAHIFQSSRGDDCCAVIVRTAIAGDDAAAKLSQVFAAAFLAPALEEIIYRGVLLAWAADKFSPGLAVTHLLSSESTFVPLPLATAMAFLSDTGILAGGRMETSCTLKGVWMAVCLLYNC